MQRLFDAYRRYERNRFNWRMQNDDGNQVAAWPAVRRRPRASAGGRARPCRWKWSSQRNETAPAAARSNENQETRNDNVNLQPILLQRLNPVRKAKPFSDSWQATQKKSTQDVSRRVGLRAAEAVGYKTHRRWRRQFARRQQYARMRLTTSRLRVCNIPAECSL